MRILMSLAAALLVALGAYAAFQWSMPERAGEPIGSTPAPEANLASYANEEHGIAFSYPAGYRVEERTEPGSAQRERFVVVLTREEDLPAPESGEGPPTITVMAIQNNLDKQTAEEWIRGSSDSNFKLSPDGALTPIAIGGKDGLMYRWDGLYPGTTIVFARADWIYAFSGTYLEPTDAIARDFETVVDSARIRD